MDNNLNEFRNSISKLLESMEIIVTDLSFKKDKKYSFLTVELDKVGGIDLDTVVMATKIINKKLDEMDFIDDSFILDVVSKENG